MGNSNYISKELALKCIQALPDEFTLEELADRLVLVSKIEQGLKDAAKGKVIKHDEILSHILRK
jgi:predicted transcriptional regulator